MNLSFKLAIAYLRKQKGKSLSLITIITLAVILIFTLNVIPESKSKLDIENAYKNFSDYHVEYNEIDSSTISKLKNDKTIEEISDVVHLGDIVSDEGVSISLNSYNQKLIDAYGYSFIKGNKPKNENEIVIEEKALKEMGLSNNLGQNIDFNIIKKYVDVNNQNQIYSNNKTFKLVGIVKKTNEFYEGNPYYKVKAFTYLTENQTIISKELITHAGVLKFKSSTPSMSMTNATIAKYNLDGSNFMLNSPLNEVLEDYNMAKNSDFSIKNKLIPVIATTLVIYNIFNIILIDMIRQIGILRTIGMSKNDARCIILIQSFIVLIMGLVIGFFIGVVVSYIGLICIYKTNVNVYISKNSVIETIKMVVIAVMISSGFTIYKCGSISPMESIRSTSSSNSSYRNWIFYRLIRKVFGFTSEIAYKNIWRYKIRTILSVLSISIAGILFISKMSVYNQNDKSIDNTNISIMNMGGNDIILSYNKINSSEIFNEYTKDQISEIALIDGVDKLTSSINLTGYLSVNKGELSSYYTNYISTGGQGKNIEISASIKGYNDEKLKSLEKYIEYGKNIDSLEYGNIPNAIISNNFYSPSTASNNVKVLKDLEIGDIVKIRIPVNEDGEIKYKNQKIRVSGILNKDYVIKADGGIDSNFQVIMDEKSFEELTGKQGVNNIYLDVKDGEDRKIINKIESIVNNNAFKTIESKYDNRKFYSDQSNNNKKEVLVSVVLTMIISSINIICIVITNIMIRTKEISTLRAIGMSMNSVKKMIIKESALYGILSSLVSGTVSTYNYYKYVKMTNRIYSQGLDMENMVKFSIPKIEILQFSIVSIVICIIAGYLAKIKIEKLSIVEGLRNE